MYVACRYVQVRASLAAVTLLGRPVILFTMAGVPILSSLSTSCGPGLPYLGHVCASDSKAVILLSFCEGWI